MNPLSLINPVPSGQAARLVSEDTFTDLAERITSAPAPEPCADRERPARRRPARSRPARRRWLIRVPAAGALAAAALVAAGIVQVGPAGVPAAAQALSFTRYQGWIEVTVNDTVAVPAVYRKEFRAHGLNVQLATVPASPSALGEVAVVASSQPGIDGIPAKGTCTAVTSCPVGLRIPAGYQGRAELVLGRPARTGEKYVFRGQVTAPGEAMHGLRYQGRTVAAVLAMLRSRHVSAARFTLVSGKRRARLPASEVPQSWFVYVAQPWAAHQVELFVGPARHVPPFPYGTQFSTILADSGLVKPAAHH